MPKRNRQFFIILTMIVNALTFFFPALMVRSWDGGPPHPYIGYQWYSYWVLAVVLTVGSFSTWEWDDKSKSIGKIIFFIGFAILFGVFLFDIGACAYSINRGYWVWFFSALVGLLWWVPLRR